MKWQHATLRKSSRSELTELALWHLAFGIMAQTQKWKIRCRCSLFLLFMQKRHFIIDTTQVQEVTYRCIKYY